MSTNSTKTIERETPWITDRVFDAARHAAHLSHEAHAVKSLAEDAIDDGLHAARRAVRQGVRRLEDMKDDGVYYVKRQPLKSLAIAAGAGFMAGLAGGWIAARVRSERVSNR